jgi:pyrimidine operon attenuation protein/uracil phosphoribosyltransferase
MSGSETSIRPQGAQPDERSKAPSSEKPARVVLDAEAIDRCLKRIAHEIGERNPQTDSLALVAIMRGGFPVGEMIAAHLGELIDVAIPFGALDVTLYRDDVIGHGRRPVPQRTNMPFSLAGRRVILIDDVVFTGRTIRAAMDAVLDFGRPQAIQVATLVDRGHRELPIQVDYVGKNIPTARTEQVVLRAREGGDYEVVLI